MTFSMKGRLVCGDVTPNQRVLQQEA